MNRAREEKKNKTENPTTAEVVQPANENPGLDYPGDLPEEKELPANPAFEDREQQDYEETFAKMAGKKSSELEELTSDFLKLDEFRQGEERDYICVKKTTTTDKLTGETRQAFILQDREGRRWLCASTVAVNAFNKLFDLPAPVRIRVNGKRKAASGGSYYDINAFCL